MNYKEMLRQILDLIQRIRTMEIVSQKQLIVFCMIMAFGLLNCILGYRLLRFWVMLFGFAVGAGLGFFIVRRLAVEQKIYYLAVMIALGIILAVIAFLVYRAGIFLLAAGLAMMGLIYFLRPTTSAMFFACILAGAVVGMLGTRFSREVLIIATSLMGGALAGLSLGKILALAEYPFGIGLSAGFALLGLLIQFATNPAEKEEDDEDDDDEDDDDTGDEEEKKNVYSADSVDFKLPGGYDKTDDSFSDDIFYDDFPEGGHNARESEGRSRGPSLFDLKSENQEK